MGKLLLAMFALGVALSASASYILVKSDVECKSSGSWLGKFDNVGQCAEQCNRANGCVFFIFGKGAKAGKCYMEKTSQGCPEGWETDAYDFYQTSGSKPTGLLEVTDTEDRRYRIFTATLGAKNGVPSREYQFVKVKLGSTEGNYNDLMIKKCKSLGMKPVCDYPAYCKRDSNSIYLGQDGYLSAHLHRQNKNLVPSGFSKIVHYWDGLCGYVSSASDSRAGSKALCNIPANSLAWKTPQQANPGFICAKVVHTSDVSGQVFSAGLMHNERNH